MAESLAARLVDWPPFRHPEPWFFEGPHPARFLRDRWDALCREAAATRRIDELHAERGKLLSVFDRLVAFYKSYLSVLDLHTELSGEPHYPRWPHRELARATEEVAALRASIFDRWHTLDDLHQLLIEKFSVPADRLRELAARHAPPPSWGEETDDPFAGE